MTGLLITVEGTEGSGKTSLLKKLAPLLQEKTTNEILVTREPGGSKISELIRQIILDNNNQELDVRSEALLFAASRRQLVVEVLIKALQEDKIILLDRFVDSSLAYQGVAENLGIEEIKAINQFVTNGITPDLTLFLDLDVKLGLQRIKDQRGEQINRLDLAGLEFHQKVYQGYLQLAKAEPARIKKISANQSLDQVVAQSLQIITRQFPTHFGG